MSQKIIGILIVVLCVVLVGVFFLSENKNLKGRTTSNEKQDHKKEEKVNGNNASKENKKVLIVYYSATNNTKTVAEKIAKNLNGDIFEIEPQDEYISEDLNYNNPDSRVSKEHDNESLRNVKLKTTKVDNWDSYDTVLIGYPIWWGVAAWPVNTFVKENNFNGKTVIPFCTSVSSELGQSGKLLEEEAKSGNWLEGKRFSSSPSDSDIKTFTDSIK